MVERWTEEVLRSRDAQDGARLSAMAEILDLVRHPGVVALGASPEGLADPTPGPAGTIELRLRWPVGQTLRELAPALRVGEIAGLGAVLATTLADLHDLGVAHGGVGMDAVIVTEVGAPVLGGFQAATWLDGPSGTWPRHPAARDDDCSLADLLLGLLAGQGDVANDSARAPSAPCEASFSTTPDRPSRPARRRPHIAGPEAMWWRSSEHADGSSVDA